jgi:hypothetical protein
MSNGPQNLTTLKIAQQNVSLGRSLAANLEILEGITMITDSIGKITDINNTVNVNGANSATLTILTSIYNLLNLLSSKGVGNFVCTSNGSSYIISFPYFTTTTTTNSLPIFTLDVSYFYLPPVGVTSPTPSQFINWTKIAGSNGPTNSDALYVAALTTFKYDIQNLLNVCQLFIS